MEHGAHNIELDPQSSLNEFAADATAVEDQFIDNRGARREGNISACNGQTAIISASTDFDEASPTNANDGIWAIGQLISVAVGEKRIVGLIYEIETVNDEVEKKLNNKMLVHIELVGEISKSSNGHLKFSSGISGYPQIGAVAHKIRAADLAAVYENNETSSVQIGSVTQDDTIPAQVSLDALLSRHFAVVGTTGVGKSSAVTLLLNKIVDERPDIRTLVLDPHNEFASAFPDKSVRIDASNLNLPFWMFTLTEFVEVINRGRSDIPEETDILRDLIPEAKIDFQASNEKTKRLSNNSSTKHGITADTPLPYRIEDLIALIDDRLGKLESKSTRPFLTGLRHRLNSLISDPRFAFMFSSSNNPDAMNAIISKMFRIPNNGKPICIFELSGLPSEVVNVVVSVVCRIAFELGVHSSGTIQTLVICEEAHRYIPIDPDAGFWPTRAAISRIAKEGRKYGVYLGVVSQRPGELDPTILSQCNTVFSMRLGNDSDQEIVKKAINGATRSTTSFLSSLANRECIAFGEGIGAPMRMMFEKLDKDELPGSNIYDNQQMIRSGNITISLDSVITKMAATTPEKQNDIEDDIANLPGIEETQYSTPHINPAIQNDNVYVSNGDENIDINFFPLQKPDNEPQRMRGIENESNLAEQYAAPHTPGFRNNQTGNTPQNSQGNENRRENAAGLIRSFRNNQ